LVKPAKRTQKKTRVIEQPGLDYLILVRLYFGDFLDWYKSNTGMKFKHAIGIDKEVAWKDIACELLSFSGVGLAFDYSQWDGSVPPWCFDIFESFVRDFYVWDEAADNARHTLLYMLRCANLLVANQVRVTDRGNKSGNPFTDVFNSVCNASVMMMAYVYLKSWNGGGMNVWAFDEDVRMLTYGDDMICSVRPSALSFFNGETIGPLLASFGFTLTDAQKSENGLVRCVPILSDQFTFLKTPFIYDRKTGTWLAPLPLDVIVRELMWIPRKMFGDERDKSQRVMNVMRFLAHHPQETYEKYAQLMRYQGLIVNTEWQQLRAELRWKQYTMCRGEFR